MERDYSVSFGSQIAGKVQVQRQGLYYRFVCRCRLSGDVICRLIVQCGNRSENLGIVVPVDGGFGLETKLPIKRIGEGPMTFSLRPKHEIPAEKFIPIYPEEPFSYIERLKEAFLERRNGQLGIIVNTGTE